MKKLMMFALVVSFVAGACGGDEPVETASPTPTPSIGPRPESTATLSIVEPRSGATVQGPDVDVVVSIEGATVLERASRELRPDTGHVHVSVNDRVDTLLAGERYTIKDLDPGEYIIKVEFAAADHGSFSPPVIETVRITVT